MTYFENKNESLGDRMRRKAFTAPGMPIPGVPSNGNGRTRDEMADEATAALTGDLSEKPIPWLLMLAQQYEVTGRLQIGLAACPVVIQFGLGRPIHAQSPFCTGIEAIMDLFIWKDGKVKFEPGNQTDSVTIQESSAELIARGEDYAYNNEYLQQHGITELSFLVRPPTRHAVGEVERRLKDGQPIDSDLQMEFFSNTYGTRNIKDTAEKLSLRPSQWVSIAANLLQLGILLAPDGRSIATEDGNGNENPQLSTAEFESLKLPQSNQAATPDPLNNIWQTKVSSGEVTQGIDTAALNAAPPVRKLSKLGEITQGINIGRSGEVTQGIDTSRLNAALQNANQGSLQPSSSSGNGNGNGHVAPSVSNPNLPITNSPTPTQNAPNTSNPTPNTSDSQPKVKLSRLGEITQGMNVAALHERIRSQSLAQNNDGEGNGANSAASLSPNASRTGMAPASPSPNASQTGMTSPQSSLPNASQTGMTPPSASQTGMPPAVQPSLFASRSGMDAAMQQSPFASQTGMDAAQASPFASQTGMDAAQASPFTSQTGMNATQASPFTSQTGMDAAQASPFTSQTGMDAAQASPFTSQTGLTPAAQLSQYSTQPPGNPSPNASQTGVNPPDLPSPFKSLTNLQPVQPVNEQTTNGGNQSPSTSQTGVPRSSFSSLADVSAAMLSSKAPPTPVPSQSGEITANMTIPPSIALPRHAQPTTPQAIQEMTISPPGGGAGDATTGLPGHIVILDPTDHNRILNLLTSPESGIFTFDALHFFLAREFDRACRFKNFLTLMLFSIRRSDDKVVSPEVATLVTATVSRIKRDVDIFGHFGSRAYALVLPNVDSTQACLLVDRINKDLIAITPDLKEFNVSLHFGLATVPQDAAELNGLVKSAQVAMFHAASNRILRTQAVQLRK